MEIQKKGALLFFLLSSLWAQEVISPVSDTGQVKVQGESPKALGVEEVKAKAMLRIEDAQKPPLQVTPDPLSPIDQVLRQREQMLTLEANPIVEQALNRSVVMQSPVLRVPIFHSQLQSAVRIPLPAVPKRDIREWRVDIVNSLGIPVQTIEGKGAVPEFVEWDGKAGSNGWAIPGEPYAYRLTVYTQDGSSRTFLGDAFKVKGWVFRTPEGMRIRVAMEELFQPGTSTLTAKGDTLLNEIWNTLKEQWGHSWVLHLYMKDPVLMEARKKAILGHLQEHMVLDPASVQFVPHPLTGNPIFEMMEVVIP